MESVGEVVAAGARLGLRILAGEEADSIPPGPVKPQTYVVNWPALQKWGLDSARLPDATIIRNRSPSVWDEYREQILIFATLLVLQTLLIRSEEHASELQSLMRISYAVFCLKKKKTTTINTTTHYLHNKQNRS